MNEMLCRLRANKPIRLACKWLCCCMILILLTGCKGLSSTQIDTLGGILANVSSELPAVWKMLIALSYVMGIGVTLIGLFRLKKYGQQTVMMMSSANIGEPMIFIVTGALLFYLPSTMNMLVETVWGYGTSGIGSGDSPSVYPSWDEVIGPVMRIMQIIGLVALIRGISMLTRLAGQAQPGTIGKAFVHIIAGTMAINIYGTIDVIQNTLF
jgi:intracellular multiplication protein IcmC